jgi:ArsR family transcriptional regulator, arsenate/arsenite/antimonite-responsive transcriptional repressor
VKGVARRAFEVVEENDRAVTGATFPEERVEGIVALGRALSDPIRVKMLGMMAEAAASGRGCCDLPDRGVPAEDEDAGICVCEFEDHFGIGQSKVSYHVRKLKDAGLVREERRGKWSFYSLDRDAARELLGDLSEHLGARAGSAAGV